MRRPKFPQWCCVKYKIIGPNPFAGSRVADRWDIPRPQGRTRKINRPPIPPLMLYKAAQLMDTSEKPSIASGIMTTAADIKKQLGYIDRDRDAQEAAARAQEVAQRFYQALAPALTAGVTSGPHRAVE